MTTNPPAVFESMNIEPMSWPSCRFPVTRPDDFEKYADAKKRRAHKAVLKTDLAPAHLIQGLTLAQEARENALLRTLTMNTSTRFSMRTKMRFDFFRTPRPEPEFHPAHSLVGFESPEKVEGDRRRLESLLREGNAAQQRLAEIIAPCRQGARCGSAACRVCGRRFRIHFGGHLAELIANDYADWWAVSLVPADCIYPLGRLHEFDPNHFKDRIRKQLERSELADAAMVLGLDFAVQIFSQSNQAPLWRPHGYTLIRGHSTEAIHAALDPYHPPGPRTPRPIRSRMINKKTILQVTSYAFKCGFNIRSQIGGVDRDTQKRPLDPIHLLETAPLLHRWGFSGRYLLRGLRRTSPAAGKNALYIDDPFIEFVRGN